MVYLLHFERPICAGRPARHYLGYASDIDARLAEHRAGRGARIVAVAQERGIGWTLARVWEGDRRLERKLKRWKNGPCLCPICAGLEGKNGC